MPTGYPRADLGDLGDLVRAFAGGGSYLRKIAAACYAATEREAMELRAEGLSPDHADTMNRVAGALGVVAAAGEMQ